jgi:hypothetical protein
VHVDQKLARPTCPSCTLELFSCYKTGGGVEQSTVCRRLYTEEVNSIEQWADIRLFQ